MNQQAPPTKLFREEGKTGSIQCPACGAPITLHAFGAIEQVACAYCGTVCAPEDNGNLDILQQAQREHRDSVLPLHGRGEIDGITWEIIGITWREVAADGMTYPWQEFLLFNPYQGFRWLIYSMSDGVWSFGGPLPGAAEVTPGMQPTARYGEDHYKHFTTGNARTTYVEGEFPWRVMAGDVAEAHDYVCPPKLISIEVQHTEQGSDVNFTQMRPIEPEEVWRAFSMEGDPPTVTGVHPAAPNPHATKFYWIAAILLFVAWVVAMVAYASTRAEELVYSGTLEPGQVISEEIQLGEKGKSTTLELELRAYGMKNSWAYAEVMLVDLDSEQAMPIGLEVDAWSGVSGGESWSEGTNPRRIVIGGVEGGTYLMQAQAQIDKKAQAAHKGTATNKKTKAADKLKLTIKRDIPLPRYMFFPLIFIVVFPVINFVRKKSFETQRWSTSDHAFGESWEE